MSIVKERCNVALDHQLTRINIAAVWVKIILIAAETHVRACRLKRRTATVVLNNHVVLNNEVLGLVDYQVHHVQCTELRA